MVFVYCSRTGILMYCMLILHNKSCNYGSTRPEGTILNCYNFRKHFNYKEYCALKCVVNFHDSTKHCMHKQKKAPLGSKEQMIENIQQIDSPGFVKTLVTGKWLMLQQNRGLIDFCIELFFNVINISLNRLI